MKDYFNAEERVMHLAILAFQTMSEKLLNTKASSPEEEKELKKINKACSKFNRLVFDRLGDAYERKLLYTLRCNELRLCGKYAPTQEAINHCPDVDVLPLIRELQQQRCLFCELDFSKNEHLKCPMYKLGVAMDLEDKNENGCPFQM